MDVESKQTIDEAIDRAKAAVTDLLSQAVRDLDGWKLEITIPPITIRLSKPKEPQ